MTTRSITLGDRRQLALERMQSKRRHPTADKRAATRAPAGPAPTAFYVIAVVVAVFVMLGLVMVLSASATTQALQGASPYRIFNRQLLWAALGTAAMFVAFKVPLLWWRRCAIPMLILGLGAMALPFTPRFGMTVNDATAWVRLGQLSVQPSEFLKLAVLVFSADLLSRRHRQIAITGKALFPITVVAALGAGACLLQGDLGSAIVLAAIVLAIAFVAGVPIAPLGVVGLAGAAGAFAFAFSSPRRFNRFTAFLDVTGNKDYLAYQTYQGYVSIANGGITGSGIGGGKGKLGYLPLAHSDFIFAVIADELGLIGAIAVIGGFALLVFFGLQTALAAPDRFSSLLAAGIAAWFGVQALVNLGGVTGLMPVTGLTLPFFSAGGTSLFASMTAAGLLLNVARRAR